VDGWNLIVRSLVADSVETGPAAGIPLARLPPNRGSRGRAARIGGRMNAHDAVALFQKALWTAVLLSAPMLLFGLIAGLIVSIFQAVTQVQEMTLTFIPKILAVVLSLFLFLPWMLNQMVRYTIELFGRIPTVH